MKTTIKEKQCQEALKRIGILAQQGIQTDIDISNLLLNGELCFSKPMYILGKLVGVINTLTDNNRVNDIVNEFRMNHPNVLPYFIMIINTNHMGELITVLYVSDSEEEWQMDCTELENKSACAYTYTVDEDFWEIGFIKYDVFAGGPIRIA